MLRAHTAIVALAICLALIGDSWGQSQRSAPSGQPKSNQSAQPTATDPRGTDQSPLAIKILPSSDAAQKTEKEERDREEKAEMDRRLTIATENIGRYTLWLASVTLALFLAAISQIALFYVQLGYMRDSLGPAVAAANAATTAAEATPKTERAYVFLSLQIVEDFREFILTSGNDTKTHSRVEFGFRNHGRTPAIVEELHVTAQYWPKNSEWPAMPLARGTIIQKGFVISAAESVGGYEVKFPLTREDLTKAGARNGYILFWGKIVYLDVFQRRHETGWCRGYQFTEAGWHFTGDERLNYYN